MIHLLIIIAICLLFGKKERHCSEETDENGQCYPHNYYD